ncbi:MAG: amino acid permease, partial [Acidobacteria bacterium]|nr:amino acid permease [Acidobacteriota bacterium]
AFRLGSWSNFIPFVEQRPGSLPLAEALGAGLVLAFFSFGGWWDVSKISGEVRDPGRNLPRAMQWGVLIVTVAYVAVSAVFLYLMPLEKVTSDEAFVAGAGEVLFGHAGAVVFAAIVAVCVLGSLAAIVLSAPRVYYAMAADGLFFHSVARIHPRFATPVRAILIQAAIASLLVVTGSFQQIIAYFIFAAVVFLGLAAVGLFIARRRQLGQVPVFLAPAYPLPPLAFVVLVGMLLVLLGLRSPRQAMLGAAVVLAGVPAFALFGRRTRASVRAAPSPVHDG